MKRQFSPRVLERDAESQGSDSDGPERWDEAKAPPDDLDDDVFAAAISDLTRDFQLLAYRAGETYTFAARFATDFFLLFTCMFVQLFLLYQVKHFVTAKAVHDIRIAYDAFEIGMYTTNPECYEVTANGFHRGIPSCFDASAFDNLSEDVQAAACRIPLSQPYFFITVLWIWTVVCMGSVYKSYRQFRGLIVNTKTVPTMHTPFDGDLEAGDDEQIIQQLSLIVKVIFTVFIILPKACMALYLLWLGCRWLLATNNFGDLILNAVALEFILVIGEVMYAAMLPERNKHDLSRTKMLPTSPIYSVGCKQFGKVIFFNLVCLSWVYGYMYSFQMVLPDYRWDVHDVCVSWINERFEV